MYIRFIGILLFLQLISFTYAETNQKEIAKFELNWSFLKIIYKRPYKKLSLFDKHLYSLEEDKSNHQILFKENVQELLENTIFDASTLLKEAIYIHSNEEVISSYQIFWEKIFLNSVPSYISLYSEYSFNLLGTDGLFSYLPMKWDSSKYYELEANEQTNLEISYAQKKAYNKKHVFSTENTGRDLWTGLLILVPKDIHVIPAINPKLLSKNGRIIYGAEFISREVGVKKGILCYVDSISNPLVLKRVGKNPLIFSAISILGFYPVNIVLSNKDVNKIFEFTSILKLLRNAKIIIVRQ